MMGYKEDIAKERTRQIEKWGDQNHDPATWIPIALEELGEVAKAYLEGKFKDFRKEMTHVAAVSEACLESLDKIYEDPHFYLAGPMLDCENGDIFKWREYVKEELNCKIIIPKLFQDDHDCGEIVNSDKRDIDRSVGIIANCWKYSPGTSMEILYAKERGKLVISVVPPELIISAWIAHHSSVVYRTLDSAITFVNEFIKDL